MRDFGSVGGVVMDALGYVYFADFQNSVWRLRPDGGVVVDPGRAAVRIAGAALTPEVLPMLRVTPSVGRIPGPEKAATTVLLGHDLWQEAYEGDPGAVGRMVDVSGEPRSIVGVLPEGFGFPFKQNAWVILAAEPLDTEPVELVGRLTGGATSEEVQIELAGRWTRGDALREADERKGMLQVESYTGSRGEGGETVAFVGLVLMALALLLIGYANVANLLLVRATCIFASFICSRGLPVLSKVEGRPRLRDRGSRLQFFWICSKGPNLCLCQSVACS